jgi:hypothetical protein
MPGPLPGAETPFGRSLPPDRSRSALVVSHHLDGLLHKHGRGHVAARCRQGFTSTGEPPTGEPADDAPASAHTPQNTNPPASPTPALRVRALTRIDNDCAAISGLYVAGGRVLRHRGPLLTCRFPARARNARRCSVCKRLRDRTPQPWCRIPQPGGCVLRHRGLLLIRRFPARARNTLRCTVCRRFHD